MLVENIGKTVRKVIGDVFPDDARADMVDMVPSEMDAWSSAVCDGTVKALQQMGQQYKYAVTCTLMQNTGAGVASAASCYWDVNKDGEIYILFLFKMGFCFQTRLIRSCLNDLKRGRRGSSFSNE